MRSQSPADEEINGNEKPKKEDRRFDTLHRLVSASFPYFTRGKQVSFPSRFPLVSLRFHLLVLTKKTGNEGG